MFSSDRSILAALIGWLVFVSFISWDASQQQKPEVSCEAGTAANKCRPQQYVTERAGIASTFERAISNPEPRTGQDHEKRDLAAQEASAVFAFWMVLISAFGAVVTTLATVLLYQQIRLTREAVEDTGKATKAMQDANAIARAQANPIMKFRPQFFCSEKPNTPAAFSINFENSGASDAHNLVFSRVEITCPLIGLNAYPLRAIQGNQAVTNSRSFYGPRLQFDADIIANGGYKSVEFICNFAGSWDNIFGETKTFEEKWLMILESPNVEGVSKGLRPFQMNRIG